MANGQAVIKPTYTALAQEVGRGPSNIPIYLGLLEDEGMIRYYRPRLYRINRVHVVFCDHPDAAKAIARLDKRKRKRSPRGVIIRPWRRRR